MNSNTISLHCAVITDLHYTRTPNVQIPSRRGELALQLLREAFDFYETRNPDLVLIAGDCLNDPRDPEAAALLGHALHILPGSQRSDAHGQLLNDLERLPPDGAGRTEDRQIFCHHITSPQTG